MLERISDFCGYLVRWPALRPARTAVLFFHGFPGNGRVKNLDIAYWLHQRLEVDCYIYHYPGLGEGPGEFLFTESVQDSLRAYDHVAARYEQVIPVGHSWGGLVSYTLMAERPVVSDAILLSPLSGLDRHPERVAWLTRGVKGECPGIFGGRSEGELTEDLERLKQQFDPETQAKRICETQRLHILQSATDNITPPAIVKNLLTKLRCRMSYLELPLDHAFSEDRKMLADAITEKLLFIKADLELR